jgi:hypothetical protein
MLAGLLLLLIQDSAMDQLIRDLDSDEPAVRQKAAEALIRRGKPALPAVRKAAKDSSSPEVKERAEDILGSFCLAEVRKLLAAEPLPPLSLKPLLCREKEIEKFFPGYRFFLVLAQSQEAPIRGALLSADDEVRIYALKEDHKNKETVLLREIRKAGATVKNRDDATAFGSLWLVLAWGSDDVFKIETTDHQNETRY